MALTFAPPFNSIDIDENGFIYDQPSVAIY